VKLYTQIIVALFLTTTSLATLAADVENTSHYALQSGLAFTSDLDSLRSDLHTHVPGEK
jgi:hypothetical protein